LINAARKSPTPNLIEQRCDDRHDEVVDQSLHQSVESGADDDGYRQRYDVLLQQEVLEFLDHGHGWIRVEVVRGRVKF
jgi:hypothetical protein